MTQHKVAEFFREREEAMAKMAQDDDLRSKSRDWFDASLKHDYSYNFTWMGRPVIQYPQDIVAMQEIVWKTRPDLIIETGVAHGGSLILYASLLHLLGNDGSVIGIDIDIRSHNRAEIEAHPMNERIQLVEGSSIDPDVVSDVSRQAQGCGSVMVVLDSNHTHDHVLAELRHYAPLVSPGNYLVVFDTVVEDMPEEMSAQRPWGHGDNPKTAVWEFLKDNEDFAIDREIQDKLLLTVAPDGYLKRR